MYLMPLNGTVKNSYSGKFYVACILPLSKKLNLLERNMTNLPQCKSWKQNFMKNSKERKCMQSKTAQLQPGLETNRL